MCNFNVVFVNWKYCVIVCRFNDFFWFVKRGYKLKFFVNV